MDVSYEYIVSTFNVGEKACCLIDAGFLHGLVYNLEDESLFLRKVD
jgi:hypothetical protein